MKIRAVNPPTDSLEKSYLSTAINAGTSTFTIRNNNNFIVGSRLLIGEMGHERSEIVTILSVTAPGTQFVLTANSVFDHDADTPVYVLRFDQARFYRAVDGANGNYVQLTQIAMDVDNADKTTVYDDVSGLSSYFYKVSFVSTLDAVESQQSDPIPGSGYTRGSVGFLINEFFEEVADTRQQNMTVTEALGLLNEVNDDVITQSRRPYRFLKTSALLNTAAGNARIPLPTTLWKFDRLLYINSLQQRTDAYTRVSMNEMEEYNFDATAGTSDDLSYISIDESSNELVLWPAPTTTRTASVKLFFWKKFDELKGMADTFQTPNQRIYKLFLMGRYYRKRSIKEPSFLNLSDRFLSDYNTEIVKLQRYNKLDMGTPMSQKPDTRTANGLRRI